MERTKKPVKEVVETIKRRRVPKDDKPCIPSGSSLLNCALSDSVYGGFGQGKIVNIVGDSSAGKTMIAETMLAEMANDPQYDDYQLYLDDSEHALEMDIQGLFGSKAAKRIRAPKYDADGEPLYSDTVEQWYARMIALIEEGKPFVYVLDSLDTLTDASEYDQAAELHKAAEKDDSDLAMPASYGMAKAKLMSQVLRTLKGKLAQTKSTLVIISQTRDNINAMPGQTRKKRAGGKALEFYCSHVVWLSVTKTHKAGKKGAEEIVGRQVEARVTKNKFTGKVRAVNFDIYYDYGVDDIGSCVDFLVDRSLEYRDGTAAIKRSGAYLQAEGLVPDRKYRADLIRAIEADRELVGKLRSLVHQAWLEKEQALSLNRKPRFE